MLLAICHPDLSLGRPDKLVYLLILVVRHVVQEYDKSAIFSAKL